MSSLSAVARKLPEAKAGAGSVLFTNVCPVPATESGTALGTG